MASRAGLSGVPGKPGSQLSRAARIRKQTGLIQFCMPSRFYVRKKKKICRLGKRILDEYYTYPSLPLYLARAGATKPTPRDIPTYLRYGGSVEAGKVTSAIFSSSSCLFSSCWARGELCICLVATNFLGMWINTDRPPVHSVSFCMDHEGKSWRFIS